MIFIIGIANDDSAKAKQYFIKLANLMDFAVLFQDVQREFGELPDSYMPPQGCLYFALTNTQVVGCSAVKRIDQHTCELKCLYVSPKFRRRGIGRTLAGAAVAEARELRYKTIQLATLTHMDNAIAIYNTLGFKLIEREQINCSPRVVYMKLALRDEDQPLSA